MFSYIHHKKPQAKLHEWGYSSHAVAVSVLKSKVKVTLIFATKNMENT
jgi:hypothetical protein